MEQPDRGAQATTPPGPSLLSLPDNAHASIASYLLGRHTRQTSCLRLSEVSRVYLESYGGPLARIQISYVRDSSPARLVALLRRQTMLAEVIMNKQESAPALCEAIVQGCCRRVEEIYLQSFLRGKLTTTSMLERENLLAAALEAEAAVPALKTLQIQGLSPGGLIALARALQGDSAPVLQHIDIHGRFIGTHDEVWDSIADMVEARASLPGCARFESFEVGWWLTYAELERQIRLLGALLPSIKTLPTFY